jgi:hypothetical protein
LASSRPQFKVLWAVVIPLLVAMVNLFRGIQRAAQNLGHDLGVLGDVSSLVGVGVVGLPDVDVATAALVPTFPLIQRFQRTTKQELSVVARAIPTRIVGIRAIREVAANPALTQRSESTLLVDLCCMSNAPSGPVAWRRARLPFA